MRILSLCINDIVRLKDTSAAARKIYYFYKEISKLHRITVIDIVSISSKAGVTRVNENFLICSLKPLYPSLFYHLDRKLGIPYFHVTKVHRLLSRLVPSSALKGYDLVIFDNFILSGFMNAFSDQHLIVYGSHNVEIDWYRHSHSGRDDRDRRLAMVRRIEGDLVARADVVMAVSDLDRCRFVSAYGCPDDKVVTVPIGCTPSSRQVDKKVLQEKFGVPPGRKTVLFFGSNAFTNREAVDDIFESILPVLAPECLVLIAGSVCQHVSDSRLTPSNVRLLGFVEDLEELLRMVDVVINPVISGSGANLKTIDCLAAGAPLISTAFGMRGYEGLIASVTVCPVEEMGQRINEAPLRTADQATPYPMLGDYTWSAIAEKFDRMASRLTRNRTSYAGNGP